MGNQSHPLLQPTSPGRCFSKLLSELQICSDLEIDQVFFKINLTSDQSTAGFVSSHLFAIKSELDFRLWALLWFDGTKARLIEKLLPNLRSTAKIDNWTQSYAVWVAEDGSNLDIANIVLCFLTSN